ncbi:MAG TPA: efflux RND transporter periplasmic adaptor subunit, partial [Patescibacteria group bacterium]|nr:efflux RND transporter periplasmic adaptor subunit [Patescibacteria group bacterium]
AFTKLTVSQPIDFQKAEQNKQSQQDALAKAYEDALNTISSAYLNLPTIMSKLDSILYGTEIANTQTSIPPGSRNIDSLGNTVGPDYRSVLDLYATGADRDYQLARKKFDASFLDFKNTTRYEKPEKTESLLALNVDTIKAIAQAAKSAGNMFDKWVDLRTQQNYGTFQQVTTFQSNLNVYIGQANSALANILAAQKNIADTKQALLDATNTLSTLAQNNPRDLESAQNLLNEKKANFEKLAKGADTLDIQSAQLNVQKAQNSLYDASQKLADYTIKAPQDGVVAKLSVKVGDVVTSGTTVATFFAKQQIAEIALNEVDVAKVKNGQKATMTVEAVEGLEITGSVAQIDAIGAASQGVVSYTVKIILDTQDDRIRPGMSVSANILTNVKTDVLIVPGSAVKTRSANSAEGGGKYVQILNGAEVTQQSVITGLSNDTSVEIVSGLKEGDQVVTQTIDPSKATITTGTQRTGGSGIPGFGGGGGGGVMFRAIR